MYVVKKSYKSAFSADEYRVATLPTRIIVLASVHLILELYFYGFCHSCYIKHQPKHQ